MNVDTRFQFQILMNYLNVQIQINHSQKRLLFYQNPTRLSTKYFLYNTCIPHKQTYLDVYLLLQSVTLKSCVIVRLFTSVEAPEIFASLNLPVLDQFPSRPKFEEKMRIHNNPQMNMNLNEKDLLDSFRSLFAQVCTAKKLANPSRLTKLFLPYKDNIFSLHTAFLKAIRSALKRASTYPRDIVPFLNIIDLEKTRTKSTPRRTGLHIQHSYLIPINLFTSSPNLPDFSLQLVPLPDPSGKNPTKLLLTPKSLLTIERSYFQASLAQTISSTWLQQSFYEHVLRSHISTHSHPTKSHTNFGIQVLFREDNGKNPPSS
ncbi:hypothetical protein BLNAU_24285 [Blattamonas nauphoetae]|uniref:Uncharacterized protein n=1 Tax=Blattamonas nauphoetae TaxID=2049346 RepID=A0ABQ9WN74_9EUKA|nr:hypothetical protein BLNAU_24285 [Blattamonas nauphoetae]